MNVFPVLVSARQNLCLWSVQEKTVLICENGAFYEPKHDAAHFRRLLFATLR